MEKNLANVQSHHRRYTRRLDKRAPHSLRILACIFSALEFGLGALTLYQHTPDFAAVKRAVESSCQLSFTPVHLQQILYLLPRAYTLEWKKNTRRSRYQAQEVRFDSIVAKRLKQQLFVLTLRKQQLPVPNGNCNSLEARITLFISKINIFVEKHAETITKEFPDMTDDELISAMKHIKIEKAPLPQVPLDLLTENIPTTTIMKKDNNQINKRAGAKANVKLTEALAKPIPQDLKSLPEWLINKVRKQELSDQLLSLVMVTRKSIFPKAYLLRRLAAQAPIKDRVEEQLYLLESLVPEWLTVVLDDGIEYIKISTSCKYNAMKISLRRAMSVQT
ncbi:unnamed protein product [Peronospora belbahrii]|uniref:CDT1 Geminin-binding domain-containing protein n=1 Tax=Peronospora belbahrii TaxID=622444 RepID=A0ABN8CSL1_9STRA|nr:unnamed protein product [Peronospora belbahrii]